MTSRARPWLEQILPVIVALTGAGLLGYVAGASPSPAAIKAMGVEVTWFEHTTIELGTWLVTPAGALLGAALALLAALPGSLRSHRASTTAWAALTLLQTTAIVVALHELYREPAPPGPDELGRCGTARYTLPVTIGLLAVLPLAALQIALWQRLAAAALEAPRAPLLDDLRRAGIVAAVPCIAWTIFAASCDATALPGLPTTVLVTGGLAAAITGCGLITGAAVWLRLRRPPLPPTIR